MEPPPTDGASQRAGIGHPIMVVGGGAFFFEGGRGPLEAYWLDLARAARQRPVPRVCYIGTASGDDEAMTAAFHRLFGDVAETADLALFDRTVEDIPVFLMSQDAVFVGGGNTASLLAVWRAHGVDEALRAAHQAGVVLAGRSAGGLCWFESGTTDSFGPRLAPLDGGLGLIAGSHCPHYDGEPERRPTYHALIASGALPSGLAVDDQAAAVFDGSNVVEVVSAREGAAAYVVERSDAGVVETVLPTRLLVGAAP